MRSAGGSSANQRQRLAWPCLEPTGPRSACCGGKATLGGGTLSQCTCAQVRVSEASPSSGRSHPSLWSHQSVGEPVTYAADLPSRAKSCPTAGCWCARHLPGRLRAVAFRWHGCPAPACAAPQPAVCAHVLLPLKSLSAHLALGLPHNGGPRTARTAAMRAAASLGHWQGTPPLQITAPRLRSSSVVVLALQGRQHASPEPAAADLPLARFGTCHSPARSVTLRIKAQCGPPASL